MDSGDDVAGDSRAARFTPEGALAGQPAVGAVVLFVVTFLGHTPERHVGPLATGFGFFLPALVALGVLGAAAAAAVGGGLLGSLLVAAGPSMGFFLALGAFELTHPSPSPVWGVGTGLAATVVLGVAGFLVGTAVRAGLRGVRSP